MTRNLFQTLVAILLTSGCSSCGHPPPGDGGPPDAEAQDADEQDADEPETEDATDVDDADGRSDADGDGDEDPDSDALPAPVRIEMIEVPPDHEGLDCGPGCRQVTFSDSVFYGLFSVGGRYLTYGAHPGGRTTLVYFVDLETFIEYRLDENDGEYWCYTPTVYADTIVYPTAPQHGDEVDILWRYRVGDSFRTPLAARDIQDTTVVAQELDLHENTLVWVDAAILPMGIYALDINGGPVIGLTDNECFCYGGPKVWGRQVAYTGSQAGFANVYLVDLDTLEERNLTWEEYLATGETILQGGPALDGEWIVWRDSRNDPAYDPTYSPYNADIYGMRLPDGPREPLCLEPSNQIDPEVQGGLVVWEDYRNAEDPHTIGNRNANVDIYMLDLETRVEQPVATRPEPERNPKLWGHQVFFVAPDLIGQDAVFMVDLEEAGLVAPTP